ncbi:ATP-binding protein [Maribacter confluentis]|uniref:histidine kinase n=1 Tax=Maribacter confluentis TaxID=1656093 RepID=A0ABT8RMW9_9FLAO|nr:ATP-binding protein [Maribacter confluentis]MDO1512229.1 ATP-binding protein [Maribacter confluentis]
MSFLKNIVDDSKDAIVYVMPIDSQDSNDIDFKIVYANVAAQTLLDSSKNTLVNHTIAEIEKLSLIEGLQNVLQKVFENQDHVNIPLYAALAEQTGYTYATLKGNGEGVVLTFLYNIENDILKTNAGFLESANDKRIFNEQELGGIINNSVLDSFNNIICYVKPTYNANGVIEDFKIEYINNRMVEITREEPSLIIGKTLLEYYPQNSTNGVLQLLRECYTTEENVEFLKQYHFNDEDFWFSNRAIKMNDGIVLFSKDVSREKEYEEQLFVQNRLLTEAESVANIGSFRWNLAKTDVNYSDNVYRLFGYEPNEFESNYERLLSFVHVNDVERVKKGFRDAREHKGRTDLVFRILTKTKEIKYLNTIGECFKKDVNWYMVGVIRDVTRQIEIESNLQARNAELKRTNSDLEAFNRVASHDLQEPLRKIQMFISRLSDEEKGRMNQKSQGYLEKVKSSSDRMRNLINNLLSYSKVEEVVELPKSVNLNDVLDNVLDDLGERINELKAQISADDLPIVNGVQFQLEQLFTNLISNSLKYIKPNKKPNIQIKSTIISKNEMPQELSLSSDVYVKLQFLDNGIGFEAQYEYKIFEIFQRLHGKNEFTGTGLGLSICKKIVESHNGAIMAKGKPNVGAEFIVYLPVLI